MSTFPLIGLSSCIAMRGEGAYHEVKNQYHEAILDCTNAVAVSVPAMAEKMDLDAYVDALDGLVLTGSLSNVHPSRYGMGESEAAEPYDQRRDEVTFTLLEKGLAAGLPILCICRGFQEANVFFGGTLHPLIHEVVGFNDHRRPQVPDLAGQFAFNHKVEVSEGLWADWLAAEDLLPADRQVDINSLHLQGVDQVGKDVLVEARASDGLVEAFSYPAAPGFFWAGQFHPEWQAKTTPQYRVIFEAFGRAAAQRRGGRS